MPRVSLAPTSTLKLPMWLSLLAIVAGIAALVWGADRFVTGASALARNLGVSPLIIGLTVVGLGTSAPEVLVSVVAALDGNPSLAVGNAVGSNIANIGLILGATALIAPLQVHSTTLRREYRVVLAVSALAVLLLWDLDLGLMDGLILLALMVIITLWLIHIARQSPPGDPLTQELDIEIPAGLSTRRSLLLLVLGLAVLLASSRALVWGAVNVATALGVSDLVIGLTIVAVGTSLPEMAASITGALKGEDDIAIGNVLGSNLYNILAVLSIPGLVAPGPVSPEVLHRDLPLMLVLTLAILVMAMDHTGRGGRINRVEGAALLLAFAAYQVWLFRGAAPAAA